MEVKRKISYYDLMVLKKAKMQPDFIIAPVDKDVELFFDYCESENTYRISSDEGNEPFLDKYDECLDNNITEDSFFEKNIKIVYPYEFENGEYVSYYDLMTSVMCNSQPYKVRIHINDLVHDYIYDVDSLSESKCYIDSEKENSSSEWEHYLSRVVTDKNWFEKNIEIIEKQVYPIFEGAYTSTYFNIFPISVKDKNGNTDKPDNLEEMLDVSISIEEHDVDYFLSDIIEKYFDSDMLVNVNRDQSIREDNSRFKSYVSNNFYTYESIDKIISDIKEIVGAFENGNIDSKADDIKKLYKGVIALDNLITVNTVQGEQYKMNMTFGLLNFYKRFVSYLETMAIEGKRQGFEYITFRGPIYNPWLLERLNAIE